MSDTPRTDKNEWDWNEDCSLDDPMIVTADFARQLERELAEAKQLIASFEEEVNKGFNRTAECEKQHGPKAVADVAYAFRLLAEARELSSTLADTVGALRGDLANLIEMIETWNARGGLVPKYVLETIAKLKE